MSGLVDGVLEKPTSAQYPEVAEAAARPTPAEIVRFESEWPDRSRRQRVGEQMLTHDEALRSRFGLGMTEKRWAVLVRDALGEHLDECLRADPSTTLRLVHARDRRKWAREHRTLEGLS